MIIFLLIYNLNYTQDPVCQAVKYLNKYHKLKIREEIVIDSSMFRGFIQILNTFEENNLKINKKICDFLKNEYLFYQTPTIDNIKCNKLNIAKPIEGELIDQIICPLIDQNNKICILMVRTFLFNSNRLLPTETLFLYLTKINRNWKVRHLIHYSAS